MKNKTLHIISFDVPLPADYGGVIDVFYKIKSLAQIGCEIILHVFEYGRERKTQELMAFCKEVHYYNRKTGFLSQLSFKPYIVKSRENKKLIHNLKKDNFPILCEGLHTASIMENPEIDKSRVFIRPANVEFDYYKNLAKTEPNLIKRLFYNIESKKLKSYDEIMKKANSIICVSDSDRDYYKALFKEKLKIYSIFPFHADNELKVLESRGDYCFYHANLSVNENINAANYLIDNIWSEIEDIKLIIAGKNPPKSLIEKVNSIENINLIPNPDDDELLNLIRNAQINVLYTDQATGLKLKLIKVLYNSRFIILNSKMISGIGLDSEMLIIADTKEDFRASVKECFYKDFNQSELEIRKSLLSSKFSNQENAKKLVEIIFSE